MDDKIKLVYTDTNLNVKLATYEGELLDNPNADKKLVDKLNYVTVLPKKTPLSTRVESLCIFSS